MTSSARTGLCLRGRNNASVRMRFVLRPRMVKIHPRGKRGPGRTSGRNGRPNGNFYRRTSVMTTLPALKWSSLEIMLCIVLISFCSRCIRDSTLSYDLKHTGSQL
jgi:hypothetical protein